MYAHTYTLHEHASFHSSCHYTHCNCTPCHQRHSFKLLASTGPVVICSLPRTYCSGTPLSSNCIRELHAAPERLARCQQVNRTTMLLATVCCLHNKVDINRICHADCKVMPGSALAHARQRWCPSPAPLVQQKEWYWLLAPPMQGLLEPDFER